MKNGRGSVRAFTHLPPFCPSLVRNAALRDDIRIGWKYGSGKAYPICITKKSCLPYVLAGLCAVNLKKGPPNMTPSFITEGLRKCLTYFRTAGM